MSKPSDFTIHPWSSIFQKAEHETIARNCMIIQKQKYNNEWTELTWEMYKEARIQDGAPDNWMLASEQKYFDDVSPYCTSAEKAAIFSPAWRKITFPELPN